MLNGACGAGVLDVRYQVYGQLMQGQLDNFDPWYWSLRLLALVPRNPQEFLANSHARPAQEAPPESPACFPQVRGPADGHRGQLLPVLPRLAGPVAAGSRRRRPRGPPLWRRRVKPTCLMHSARRSGLLASAGPPCPLRRAAHCECAAVRRGPRARSIRVALRVGAELAPAWPIRCELRVGGRDGADRRFDSAYPGP